MRSTDHGRYERLIRVGVWLNERRRHEAGPHLCETRLLEPPGRRRGVRELPGLLPGREIGLEARFAHQRRGAIVKASDIRAASALGNHVAAWLQRGVEAAKKLGMVAHPVKGRGAEYRVSNWAHGQRRGIRDDELDLAVESRAYKVPGDLQHVGRQIDADDAAMWETFEQLFGQPAGSAADVEDELVALEREPVEHDDAPIKLRCRDLVI